MAACAPFAQRLAAAVRARGTPLVVGLDPHWNQMPSPLIERWRRLRGRGPQAAALAVEEFCRRIIDTVAPLVPAVKVQSAFFEQLGPPGMQAMDQVMTHACSCGLLVIFDGKRNDIGSTAEAYAAAYLGRKPRVAGFAGAQEISDPSAATADMGLAVGGWPADAITVNPYLGLDSLEPFVRAATDHAAGVFVLVKTSNPGSSDFQDLDCQGQPLYRHVAQRVERLADQTRGANRYGAVGAVVGATHPNQVPELRATMPHTWFLLPGFGAQGAGVGDVKAAIDDEGLGALVNSSRAILFAYRREPYASRFGENHWQQAVEQATRDTMADLAG